MSQINKQQSNPFSTGGGGTNFETRIQAAFTVLMLTGRISPCLPPHSITKLKLQGSYVGFNTDDFIVFSKQPQSEREARLLAQIKHDIGITEGNETFAEVIQSTWADFNDRGFDSSVDSLALITGPLSATDIKNVRPILEWARHSENEQEFLTKVDTPKFSSDVKRKKLAAFKTHLKTANGGKEVSDKQLWEFLKAFHLIGYDLDADSGSTLSLLQSLIAQYSKETVSQLWARIVGAVQEANQNAGTLTLETIPVDIRTAFDTVTSLDWSADVQKLRDHGRYILGGIKTNIGGIHIKRSDLFAEFLEMTETSNFIFVSGERGSGKSSLIKNFSDYVEDRSPIFCLRIEDLDKPHLDNIFSTIGLRGSLTELEAGFALMPKKYLIIESLEKLLELNFTNAFRDLLHLLNQNQGWTVIATGRDYAYQPISFNYLQPSGINFSTLALQGFSQNQVHSLYEQVQPLQQLAENQALQPLLKIPFFADLACRVMETGAELKKEDGEKEFRVAVWRNVIAKEQIRMGGMPLKRKRCFIDIAIKRAKQMVYGVPEVQFDEDTLLKLEEDNLVSRNSEYGLVSPAHDVLEDWALEQYIEESYQSHSENVHTFLDAIGDEPAISRAFRLWLHQKLRYGDNVNDLILSILEDENIQRYWQDEAIVALLQGDNPDEFLSLLKERLFFNDGELLKRFCFVLRIACQTPDSTLTGEERNNLVDTLYLKPYGNGWKAIIGFLFKSRNLISEELTSHITAVLSDWISILNINEEIPALARQTGLLALHLLNPLKDLYRDKDRKKLLKIIIKTSSAIPKEFLNLLIEDVFTAENRRLSYVEDLCNIAFQSFESAFICKYSPSLVITLALHEWLIDIYDKNLSRQWEERSSINRVENSFGVYRDKFGFSPASGARGPFQYLLRFHPKRGLDFILKLLNITARQYAHSTLDSPIRHPSELTEILSPMTIEQIAIQLKDGTIVNQYCSSRLWNGYRGKSVLPDLLQSALMALENWLISYAEYSQSQEDLKWIFNYILRNTNSVMPTAVLASVATGFPTKLGIYALPLLRTPELYSMDTQRSVHDYGGDINWFGLRRDALSRVCEEERRIASQRPWRQKTLEHLAINLQLLQLSEDDVFAAIDTIRSSAHQNEHLHFLLQRIDTRNWQLEEDRENNRVLIKPQELEPDLQEIQQKTQEQTELLSRFSQFYLLVKDISNGEFLADKYLKTWKEVISEARELLELLQAGKSSYTSDMHYGSIVAAAAIFLRNCSDESEDDDIIWCVELVVPSAIQNADTDNIYLKGNKTDIDGAAASASVLPILLDFTEDSDDKLQIKTSIATSLTHAQEYVRVGAANGIREHLWQRDSEFAQKLIEGSVEYACFLQDNHRQARKTYYSLDDEERKAEALRLQEQKNSFREQMAKGMLPTNFEQIKLESHRAYYLLIPCLMIPYGSTEPSHVGLLSQIIKLIFQSEQAESKQTERNKDIEFHYETTNALEKCLAKHLMQLNNSEFREYIELLRIGCDTAPKFIMFVFLFVAVEAETNDRREIYWYFWKQMSQKLQETAIKISESTSVQRRKDDDIRHLLRVVLKADVEWGKTDYENQNRDIALGKNYIVEFAANAGKNADVFEALAALMYHFPSIFFEAGLHILSRHQKESGQSKLLSGSNAAFYLERAIQRFLQVARPGSLPRKIHESCFILLNAVVETASSRAYYLREHLIRSRRIL